MNAVTALPPVALNVSQPHRPRITSKIRPFRMFWPGNVMRLFKFSLQLEIRDDAAGERQRADERGEQHRNRDAAGTWQTGSSMPASSRLRALENSRLATSAAAPPPRPLKSATICGIEVIFTEYAPSAPMTRPMTVPMAMSV